MDPRFGLLGTTRRHFFQECALGLGSMALTSLGGETRSPSIVAPPGTDPQLARPGHFPARAKSVIYLFMAGAPSQFELFDFKPALQKYHNQPVPDEIMAGKRFAFMDTFAKERPKLLGT